MDEEWRQIPDYPDYYVSNYGQVFSERSNALLAPGLSANGYLNVGLYADAGRQTHNIHVIVAQAFCPGQDERLIVNHIDTNRQNNFCGNLEWVTYSENRSINAGQRRKAIRVVETGLVYISTADCARAIGGDRSNIRAALAGRLLTHRGFTFEYV